MGMWREFLDHLRHDNGDLSSFWMSYVDFVEDVILGLLRASREGNWDLHLQSIRKLIPWCFAYDRVNYARYLPPYFAQMTNLREDHPEVEEAFREGRFSVQLSSGNAFGRIPMDQTTEVTVNKDTQTSGGTTGFSLKPAAIQRYYLTAEFRSAFLRQLRGMVQRDIVQSQHTDLQKSRIKKDEQAVSSVIGLLEGWINPFAEERCILSISTAREAPQEVARDLKNAHQIGEKCYAAFKEERLEKTPPVKKFHDPIKANKLKTFADMSKKTKVKISGRSMIIKADRSLFARIVVMAQARSLQMNEVFEHALGPVPWALSSPDGLLRKTNKAALASLLEKNVQLADHVPEDNAATVIDGMALVQKVKGDQQTFADVAATVLAMALREGAKSKRIDIVFDTYNDFSIKNSERLLRGEATGHQLRNITRSRIVRQWRNFLTQVSNKTSLIFFLVNEWKNDSSTRRLDGKVLHSNIGETCYKIAPQTFEEVPSLMCRQEEADGRMLLHASHCANDGYNSVMICSDDTDVLVMALAVVERIGVPLLVKTGTSTRTKVVEVNKVAASVGGDVCKALIGMHALTGCDSVSAFAGKGKSQALKLIKNNRDCREAAAELGEQWEVSSQLMDKLEAYTCLIYSSKTKTTEVNSLRYQMFCARRGEIESYQLPPCKDCLTKHVQRANYQAGIWKRCLVQDPQVPSPVGRGWKMEEEEGVPKLTVDWMDGKPYQKRY